MCSVFKTYSNGKSKKELKDEYRVSLMELPPVKPRLSRRQSPAALVSDERT